MQKPIVALVFVLALAPRLSAGETPATAVWPDELSDAVWGPLEEDLGAESAKVRDTCGRDLPRDCGALALHYSRSATRLEKEPARAAGIYRLACADGFAWGCYFLAELGRQGPEPRIVTALVLHENACDDDERRSCLALGQMHETGEGTDVSPSRAEEIYARECEASRSAGCWRLGQLLDRLGAADDKRRGQLEETLGRACTGGIGAACFRLAEVLAETDAGESAVAYYYGQACDRRHPRGCLRYAERLETGAGAEVDLSLATSLFDKACDSGLPEACLRLASLYRAGRGVLRNPIVARALEDEACRLGLVLACKPAGR